jgi:hypothetical protein
MLRPCPACERHVRSSEPHCPFCEAELPSAVVWLSASNQRLGRAAAFVAGAALVATVAGTAGCGDKPPPKDPNTQKPYGAPPADGLLV